MLASTLFMFLYSSLFTTSECSSEFPIEKRLNDKLLTGNNPLIRPVQNFSDRLTVYLRFVLLRLIDLDTRDQILSLEVNIEHTWIDCKLQWNPNDFGGIRQVSLPVDQIWKPDINIYFNSMGVESSTDGAQTALVSCDGAIKWTNPAILKVLCPIEVEYYPFDIQHCNMTFGSWTYDGNHLYVTFANLPDDWILPVGMDLSQFVPSTEWDILVLKGIFWERYFNCCNEPYPYVHFNMTFRRHSQFYVMNLVMPLVCISYLSLLVFYLPVDSGEKITLCVSVFTAQVTFLLLMMDNIPLTSLAVPLLGKLIIFNMLLVFSSILCTVMVLNVYYRKPETYEMPPCVVKLLNSGYLQSILFLNPTNAPMMRKHFEGTKTASGLEDTQSLPCIPKVSMETTGERFSSQESCIKCTSGKLRRSIRNVYRIRDYLKRRQDGQREADTWKLAAQILDRFFLLTFNIVFFLGTGLLLANAPALYDHQVPLGR